MKKIESIRIDVMTRLGSNGEVEALVKANYGVDLVKNLSELMPKEGVCSLLCVSMMKEVIDKLAKRGFEVIDGELSKVIEAIESEGGG